MSQIGNDRNRYLDSWAKMMITIWQEKIVNMNIHDTGALLKSFHTQVATNADGDVSKIIHTYNYYGRMVEMGVGKGISMENRDSSTRKQKKWYTKTYSHSIHKLNEKMVELYGEEFQFIMFETYKNIEAI